MKNIILLTTFLFLIMITLTACKKDEVVKLPTNSVPLKYGNTNGNINNYGQFAYDDGNYYYVTDDKFCKQDKSGKITVLLEGCRIRYINAINGKLYFYYLKVEDAKNYKYSARQLCSMSSDGSNFKVLLDDLTITHLIVNEKYIYYSYMEKEEDTLYRMKLDGSEKRRVIIEERASNITDNSIYFCHYMKPTGLIKLKFIINQKNYAYSNLYVCDLNSENMKLLAKKISWMVAGNDGVYYVDGSEKNIYKIKRGETNSTKIFSSDDESRIMIPNISGEYIYFYTSKSFSNAGAIKRVKLDGSDLKVIVEKKSYKEKTNLYLFCIVGDKIRWFEDKKPVMKSIAGIK